MFGYTITATSLIETSLAHDELFHVNLDSTPGGKQADTPLDSTFASGGKQIEIEGFSVTAFAFTEAAQSELSDFLSRTPDAKVAVYGKDVVIVDPNTSHMSDPHFGM